MMSKIDEINKWFRVGPNQILHLTEKRKFTDKTVYFGILYQNGYAGEYSTSGHWTKKRSKNIYTHSSMMCSTTEELTKEDHPEYFL